MSIAVGGSGNKGRTKLYITKTRLPLSAFDYTMQAHAESLCSDFVERTALASTSWNDHAVVYWLLVLTSRAPLGGAVLSRLLGGGGDKGVRLVGEGRPQFWQKWM